MGLTEEDLRRLQLELLSNPKIGSVITGTGGIRKMRFAYENQGKSGSTRVIYVDFEVYEKIYLLTVYAKNEKDNLSKQERNNLHRVVEILELELEKGGKRDERHL